MTNNIQYLFNLLNAFMNKYEGKTTDCDQSGCHPTTSIPYVLVFINATLRVPHCYDTRRWASA